LKKASVDRLNKQWHQWVDQSLRMGCNPVEIRRILKGNGFSIAAIAAAMGDKCPEINLDRTLIKTNIRAMGEIDYQASARVFITRDLSGIDGNMKLIATDKIQMYTIPKFMHEDECIRMMEIIDSRLRPSNLTSETATADFRTSQSCDLCYISDPLINTVEERISHTLGIHLSYSDGTQAQKYEIGQEFREHCDYFHPGTGDYERYVPKHGNRTWTFMIFLNDTERGGGTRFPKLDKIFYPEQGRALLWNNLYPSGAPNPHTLHHGMPVVSGQKYIITKWFRAKGKGKAFR